MKVVGSFNKISEKLKKTIPVLKPGQVATFQMLNGVPNPDPDASEKIRNPMLFGKTQIPTNFRIFDPFLNDENGGYVDVGAVEIWDKEHPVRFWMLVAGFGQHQFTGKFSLVGGNIKDEELYEVLWLSNHREGNEHRDKSVEPLFRLINTAQESKATITKVDILRRALNIVGSIKPESEAEAREVWASLNQKHYPIFGELMAAMSEYAKNKPDDFLAAYDNADKADKAIIRFALDEGILEYDIATGEVTHGKDKLTVVEMTDDLLTAINSWMKQAQNGQQVLGLIKNKLNKAETKAAKTKDKQLELV